jgi:hypothetical protein
MQCGDAGGLRGERRKGKRGIGILSIAINRRVFETYSIDG